MRSSSIFRGLLAALTLPLMAGGGAPARSLAPSGRVRPPALVRGVGEPGSSSNGGHRGLGKANHRKAMKLRRVKAHRARA